MANDSVETRGSIQIPEKPRFRPLILIGGVLWLLCAAALIYGWYQWRITHTDKAKPPKAESTDDEAGQSKQIKLVPQKDGSFAVEEVTAESKDDPWDPMGTEDFSFTDTNGQTMTKADLVGKPYVISFVFTQCRGPCPNVTLQMRELQNRLKDYDFNLITLTVDPDRDTPEKLTQYGKDNGANFDRWKFLTGKQADIYGLIHRSFKMPVEEAQGAGRQPGFEIIHSTNIMLVNAEGRITGKYDAQKIEDMSRLRRDLKGLAKLKPGITPSSQEGKE